MKANSSAGLIELLSVERSRLLLRVSGYDFTIKDITGELDLDMQSLRNNSSDELTLSIAT